MKKPKLVIFDVDGTLTKMESSWQFMHEQLGTWEKAKQYKDQFFKGTINYAQWASLDVALWKGLPLSKAQNILSKIPYTKGAVETIATLKKNGVKVVLLSAGLSLLTDRIREEIGVDDALANELVVKDGCLTGEIQTNVSVWNKDKALRYFLRKFQVKAEECVAVGDDITLISLFAKVGLAIAFNPRTAEVSKHADIVVNSDDLRDILPYIYEPSADE